MNSTRLHITALAAVLGGLVYVFCGTLQITQDFQGSHNTIDSTAEYLVTGAFAAALYLTAASYRVLGSLAEAPRAAAAAIGAHVVLGTMCVVSVINGADASFFNALAPLCLLTWFASSAVIANRLRRSGAVPRGVAYALPALVITTIVLSPVGGAILTGAFWLVVGGHVLRSRTVGSLAPAPAA
jgi:hypothetical protein